MFDFEFYNPTWPPRLRGLRHRVPGRGPLLSRLRRGAGGSVRTLTGPTLPGVASPPRRIPMETRTPFRPARCLLLCALVLACGGAGTLRPSAARAQEPEVIGRGDPYRVFIGFHVLELLKVDIKTREFLADLYFWNTDRPEAPEGHEQAGAAIEGIVRFRSVGSSVESPC